jgi:uncharacterized protein DUF2510
MSRYSSELRTTLSKEAAWEVVCGYLGSEGFKYLEEKTESVWRKGAGLATIPQFINVVPADGSVHLEAWLSAVAWVPGVYTGEQDLEGVWGFALKAALKKRVAELERRLGEVVSRAKIDPRPGRTVPDAAFAPTASPMTPQAPPVAPQNPPSWSPDPSGRHQLRYWDGTSWTANVSDNGVTGQDPV